MHNLSKLTLVSVEIYCARRVVSRVEIRSFSFKFLRRSHLALQPCRGQPSLSGSSQRAGTLSDILDNVPKGLIVSVVLSPR